MATRTSTGPTFDLMFLLSQASHALATELAVGLAELDVSQRGYCVLSKARGAELTQTQIADMAALDKTTMVVAVDQLEQAGLAQRRPSTTDRRARIISVTPAGERVVDQAGAIVARIYDEVLDALPARQREGFIGALVRLVEGDGRLSTPREGQPAVRRPRVPRTD
jgi:DNA-binding MarR family transcriptional regulator